MFYDRPTNFRILRPLEHLHRRNSVTSKPPDIALRPVDTNHHVAISKSHQNRVSTCTFSARLPHSENSRALTLENDQRRACSPYGIAKSVMESKNLPSIDALYCTVPYPCSKVVLAHTAVASETPAPATPASKKPKATAAGKKPKAKPTHPKTSEMVNSAIMELKERSGSSLQAIKKYIAAQYKVDAEKLAPFIRKYLKSAVESGALIQTKGKGASGSFKLESKSAASKKPAAGKKPSSSAASAAAKPKKSAPKAKKSGGAAGAGAPSPSKSRAATKDKKAAATKKKPTAAKKSSGAAGGAKAKSAATAPKAKKTTKPPTKKPKAPKPKKAASAPKSKPAAKKATASKK
ncbi:hypothetical protein ACJJTC_014514 [Scirpophaga incertulas]